MTTLISDFSQCCVFMWPGLRIRSAEWPPDSPAGLLAAGYWRRRWGFPWCSGWWVSRGTSGVESVFPALFLKKIPHWASSFQQTVSDTDPLWQQLSEPNWKYSLSVLYVHFLSFFFFQFQKLFYEYTSNSYIIHACSNMSCDMTVILPVWLKWGRTPVYMLQFINTFGCKTGSWRMGKPFLSNTTDVNSRLVSEFSFTGQHHNNTGVCGYCGKSLSSYGVETKRKKNWTVMENSA